MYTAVTTHRQPCRMKLVALDRKRRLSEFTALVLVWMNVAGLRGGAEDGRNQKRLRQTVAIHPTAAEEFVTMR